MSTSDINAALQDITAKFGDMSPEAQILIDQMKKGELTETESLQALLSTLMQDPTLVPRLQRHALSTLAKAQELKGDGDTSLEERVIMQPPSGKGLPRLNPLLEGSLAERAQFDADIPELRQGPLPEGVQPAVPVETLARNPVALGQMLKRASEEMQKKLIEVKQQALDDVVATPEGEHPGPDPVALSLGKTTLAEKVLAVILQSEPEGYKTGNLPALHPVDSPSGAELAALTPRQSRASAWHFLSTTQGRRTAVRAIAKMVSEGLTSKGFPAMELHTGVPEAREHVPAYAEWVVSLGGAESTQSMFNLIDVAAGALTRNLAKRLRETGPIKSPVLEVIPINTVDVRKVGWAARVVPQETS